MTYPKVSMSPTTPATDGSDAPGAAFGVPASPRFPAIEEDEPPLHLLCTEYPSAP